MHQRIETLRDEMPYDAYIGSESIVEPKVRLSEVDAPAGSTDSID